MWRYSMERLTERVDNGTWVKEGFAYEGIRTFFNGYDEGYSAIEKCADYEDAEEQGLLLKLPCKVGDTVYVICECGVIPKQLDGTLYGNNGEPGTATGYYCPYEDNCPHENYSDDCKKCKDKPEVFRDIVKSITFEDDTIYISTENCCVYSQIGYAVFLTQEEAEARRAEMEQENG